MAEGGPQRMGTISETSARTSLFSEPRFQRLLRAKLAMQIAQNIILYTVLIVVVERTDSSMQSTLLVLSATLPSVVLGVPAGLVVDWLPKRALLLVVGLVRAGVCLALLRYGGSLRDIYLLVLLFSAVGQLQGPAESAGLPGLVGRGRLGSANAYLTSVILAAQIAGVAIIAPAFLKTVGEKPLYVLSGVLFLLGGVTYARSEGLGARLDSGDAAPAAAETPRRVGLWAGLHMVRRDGVIYLALVELTLAAFLMKSLVVLMPHYARDVLDLAPENSVFIATPAAVGAILGLALVPLLSWFIRPGRLVTLGLLIFIAGLVGLGLVYYAADAVQQELRLNLSGIQDRLGISSVVTMTMLLSVPLGLAFTVVSVGARTVFNRRTPPELQGRVFATQSALADLASVPPLLAVGAVADLVGVRVVLLVAAGGCALAALLAHVLTPGLRRLDASREGGVDSEH
jgi:DHA3 family macrolide efflux protein-like MFS transporter